MPCFIKLEKSEFLRMCLVPKKKKERKKEKKKKVNFTVMCQHLFKHILTGPAAGIFFDSDQVQRLIVCNVVETVLE